jgi:hypothetical protein
LSLGARAALVEDDQARESCQPSQEARQRRLFPGQLHMRDPPRDIHQVERSFTHNLVGNVHVPAAGVFGPGFHDVILHCAARLGSQAAAGEIIVSEAALNSAGLDRTGMESRSLELKGIGGRVPVRVLRRG